jgi:hypothetical protein
VRPTTRAGGWVALRADWGLRAHVATGGAGRDDITRAEAALTWRLHGVHAIGVKYTWSHRAATFPVIGERPQTLATVGLFYTLLGEQTFGAVEWRDESKR